MNDPQPILGQHRPCRLAVYGDPGVGKTRLGLTFPRPLVISTDKGLEGDALDALSDSGGLEWTPAGYHDLEQLYAWASKYDDRYDTIVFDSLDGLVRILMNEVVDQGKGKSKTLITEIIPEQAEYLVVQRQVERIVTDFRRLGKHMVVTSGVRHKDGQKRTIDVSPGLQPIVNHWSAITGELVVIRFDEQGNPTTDAKFPVGRTLLVDPSSPIRECKTRWATLLPYVRDVSFDKLWAAIAQEGK